MAFLFTDTECGPANPLQGLSKHFERDKGTQQDHFSLPGPARQQIFRTPGPSVSKEDQNAASQFFGSSSAAPPRAFDLSALQAHLPTQVNRSSNWASEFLVQPSARITSPAPAGEHHITSVKNSTIINTVPDGLSWSAAFYNAQPRPLLSGPVHLPPQHDHSLWDREFESRQDTIVEARDVVEHKTIHQDTDELSRTAGLLLESVKDEQNPKFKNSAFLSLMQKLRDREVVVEGNQVVENSGTVDIKGKGRAIEQTVPLRSSFSPARSLIPHHQETGRPDEEEEYWREENARYIDYWSQAQRQRQPDDSTWHHLQADWDQFEATSSDIRPLDLYQFQANNPYLLGDSSRTENHVMHQIPESVLELEAIVQRNMTDASAWFQLGVKQQENEREKKALQALGRAVELDPSHLPSWLALAVSHTNDGNRMETYRSIREWVQRNERYRSVVQRYPEDNNANYTQKVSTLVDCLIQMARSSLNDEVDADIQITLAVLFNANEDYTKAQDCFRAALAVCPEDWLLYNRVGATIANSGHAEEALQYYQKALELNPVYIRARYNLGIACINLRQYQQAVQHIVNALILQSSDGAKDTSGLTSKALWNSLKTACVHLGRADLSSLCDTNDIDQFMAAFTSSFSTSLPKY